MHGSSLTYAWLSDGTKVSARADDGSGHGVVKRYLGSFVYTTSGGSSTEDPRAERLPAVRDEDQQSESHLRDEQPLAVRRKGRTAFRPGRSFLPDRERPLQRNRFPGPLPAGLWRADVRSVHGPLDGGGSAGEEFVRGASVPPIQSIFMTH